MLDANIKGQLAAYLGKLQHPIELIASLDGGESGPGREMLGLLQDIAALSDKVSLRLDGQATRRPSFAVCRAGESARISFAGIPMGHEFTSLVLALLQVGGHPPKADASVLEGIRAIAGKFHFETFVSLSCHNCPDVVQALNLLAVSNPGISHQMVDGGLYQDEVVARQILGVPTVLLNRFRRGLQNLRRMPRMQLASLNWL